jgi:hypothetical protein
MPSSPVSRSAAKHLEIRVCGALLMVIIIGKA